jgi:hypothetical protein
VILTTCSGSGYDDCEAGRLAQHAQAKPQILDEIVDKLTAESLAAFLFELLAASELDPGAPFRFSAKKSKPDQVVGP